jgi:hypothetical protein
MQNAKCKMQKGLELTPLQSFGRFLDFTFCILHFAFALPGGGAGTELRLEPVRKTGMFR